MFLKSMILSTIVIVTFYYTRPSMANEYIIFSIVQDIPMGIANEQPKKNYYVNIGKHQGVSPDAILNVFRVISRQDPYSTKQRFNYKLKIGELQIIHTEDNASIGKLHKFDSSEKSPLYEIDGLMIGDQVDVNVNPQI